MVDLSQMKKFEQMSFAQWIAIGKKLGGLPNIIGILRGDLKVIVRQDEKLLVDYRGRFIPRRLSADVRDANWRSFLSQPELKTEADYANRIMRLHECLCVDTGITARQFQKETERLLALIRDNSQVVNIANSVWLPVVLPQLTTDDLGTALEQYLEAVGKSYTETFSNRKFCNSGKGTFPGKVNIVDRSRHGQLIERMKQGPVIGIHFPNSLQGFSINASREQMSILPEGFILSGMDTPIVMVMYPDILARDHSTPGLDLAALSWQSTTHWFIFRAFNDALVFSSMIRLERGASPDWNFSGGLLFLG
jgi:hypothetical protein